MSEYDKNEILRLKKENKLLKDKLESNEKPIKKKAESKYTEEELYDLNRKEQIELIRSLGHNKIPIKEADRVKLILKLTR